MTNKLEDFLNTVSNFNGAVLIGKKNEFLFKKGYGFLDSSRNMAITPSTNFGIASITKLFTSVCIMKLFEQGLLNIRDEVEKYLPSFFENEGVQLGHLLNHSSGIINYLSCEAFQDGKEYTPDEIIRFASKSPLKFKPGQKWLYSNTNYVILGKVIEIVTGRTYPEFVRNKIFVPLGLKNTCFEGEQCSNIAPHGESVFECNPQLLFATGNIISNVEDLFKFLNALEDGSLLSPETIQMMQTPSFDGKFIKYGYGWVVKNLMSHRSISAGGLHPIGYSSHLEKYVDDHLTIIVLSNKLEKYSPSGMKFFGSTGLSRQLTSVIYGIEEDDLIG